MPLCVCQQTRESRHPDDTLSCHDPLCLVGARLMQKKVPLLPVFLFRIS
ncbi:unnamed protein product [Chondrus crispus]|uniref:Uncharacterized protein n=1 Tax=Chondrus crispus TaxID=2769 RepID=R7QRN3_CHOCR|nr:unnamed protein product [Chondrus crispus]CDF39995.1 unnamed protein product [Chondrus crispus]|eukprot:XP_005710289.1 unnamed protein product [Chondrus crispus]